MPLSSILAAMAMQVASHATPQAAPPIIDADGFPSTDTEVLDTGTDRGERMTLPVRIGGEGPYDFFVDTGSQATVLSRELGDALNLPSDGSATLVGIASRNQVELVQLDGLELGSKVINGLMAPVLERSHLGADGIIGLDSLQDFRVLLDFRQGTLAIVDAEQRPSNRGFEIVVQARSKLGRLIVTDAEIDGVATTIIVDTGSQASIGNQELLQRLRRRENLPITGIDVNGATIDARLNSVGRLRIGSVALDKIPVAFSDALVFEELGLKGKPALILGMQDLRLFDRVAIDFAKKKILFDVPGRFRRGSDNITLASSGRA